MKFGMTLAFGILLTATAGLASTIREYHVFNNTAELNKNHRDIRAIDARFINVAKRVEVIRERWCTEIQEDQTYCERRTVLESIPAIQVTVEYTDDHWMSDDNGGKLYMTFNLPVEQFPAPAVEELKAASRFFGGRRVRKAFLAKYINFKVEKVSKTIQVVDMRNSRLCPVIQETNEPFPGCVEVLRYRPTSIIVNKVQVTSK